MRMRGFFAQALGYAMPDTDPDYGIKNHAFPHDIWSQGEYFVFLHGTSWRTKHWPDNYWLELAQQVAEKGYSIRMP